MPIAAPRQKSEKSQPTDCPAAERSDSIVLDSENKLGITCKPKKIVKPQYRKNGNRNHNGALDLTPESAAPTET